MSSPLSRTALPLGLLLAAPVAQAEDASAPAAAPAETVSVELRTPQPGVVVSAWTAGPPQELPRMSRDTYRVAGLQRLCTTPCTAELPVGTLTVVAHGETWSTLSAPVTVSATTESLTATPHRRGRTGLANGLTGAGIGLTVFGAGLLVLNELGPQSIDSRPTAVTLGATGLGALTGGLLLHFVGPPRWTQSPPAAGS